MRDKSPEQIQFEPLRTRIARTIKKLGKNTAQDLAGALGISYEAVRKELAGMESQSLIQSYIEKPRRGRPFRRWRFTDEGEHLFPKDYDSVLGELLGALSGTKLKGTLEILLAEIAASKAHHLDSVARSADSTTAALNLYGADDEFISVQEMDGRTVIIENNCPLLKIARTHPMICSISTNTLAKTFGKKVVRVEKFQNNDGRCVFVVMDEQYEGFQLEADLALTHSSLSDRH